MSQDTLERYTQLFQQIRENSKNSFHGIQLECISKLVFFGGVQRQLIPKLKVGDAIDRDGKAREEITTKSKKEIILNDEMKRALEDYFIDLKSRCSTYTNRTRPLFPNYSYDGILRRHWKKFGTSYSQIKRDGELYKEEEDQRRYEENKAALQKKYENGHVDMICDIDDDAGTDDKARTASIRPTGKFP